MSAREYEFRITEQDSKTQVAGGWTAHLHDAFREAYHYATQYDQDGPITVEIVRIK